MQAGKPLAPKMRHLASHRHTRQRSLARKTALRRARESAGPLRGDMALLRATALALALGSANAGGAYPELSGGASYIKLTDATFDSFINDALAAGKTAMVRWIASEG